MLSTSYLRIPHHQHSKEGHKLPMFMITLPNNPANKVIFQLPSLFYITVIRVEAYKTEMLKLKSPQTSQTPWRKLEAIQNIAICIALSTPWFVRNYVLLRSINIKSIKQSVIDSTHAMFHSTTRSLHPLRKCDGRVAKIPSSKIDGTHINSPNQALSHIPSNGALFETRVNGGHPPRHPTK